MNDSKKYKNTWWYRLSRITYLVVFGGFGLLVLISSVEKNIPEFWEHEERRIVNIIDKAETSGSVTREEYGLLEQLPPQQLESFRKDWFKEENSELLLIYKKAQQSGNISKKDFERLSNISLELQKKIQ
jgi:2-phospho-L-lactate transferase/gluconeogenesis factor (CofD/UPF0052 family)